MFELMYQQMQIAFAERINKFIYTVRRIPVIGKAYLRNFMREYL